MYRQMPFALVLLAFIAHAADDQVVSAPFVEPGDCWTYRAVRMENRGPIDEYEECITHVDWQKGLIIAVAKIKSDEREIDTSYSTDWVSRTSVEGLISTQRTTERPYRFPLRVGESYKMELEFRRAILGSNVGESNREIKVVGWEDITVPAGKFRALRIEVNDSARRFDLSGGQFSFRSGWWYVPAVNRHVKYFYEDPGGRRGEELTGYRLNK